MRMWHLWTREVENSELVHRGAYRSEDAACDAAEAEVREGRAWEAKVKDDTGKVIYHVGR